MRRAATIGAVLIATLVAGAALVPLRLVPWRTADLVAQAREQVQKALPNRQVTFFDDPPNLRTAIRATGREDYKVACGFVLSPDPQWPDQQTRFFYVLFKRGLFSVSVDTVFVQDHPGQASPEGGEGWCRRGLTEEAAPSR